MKKYKLVAAMAVAVPQALVTMPAAAIELANGMTVTGDLQYWSSGSQSVDTQSLGLAELALTWRAEQSGAVGFGADFELSAVKDIDGSSTVGDAQIWGAAVVSTSFGDLSLGKPRPQAGKVSPAPVMGNAAIIDRDLGLFGLSSGSFLDIISVQSSGAAPSIYGAGFAGNRGALSYSIAIHRAEHDSYAIDASEITLAYKSGALHLYGTVENYDFGSRASFKTMLGGNYALNKWNFGGEAIASDLSGDFSTRNMAYGTYAVNDALDLSMQVGLLYDSADTYNIVGVNGAYDFGNGAYVSAGYLIAKDFFMDKLVSLKLGYKF